MARRVVTAVVAGTLVVGLLWIGPMGFLMGWLIAGLILIWEWQEGERLPLGWRIGTALLILAVWGAGLYPALLRGIPFLLLIWASAILLFTNPAQDFYRSSVGLWGAAFLGIGWGSFLWAFWEKYDWRSVLAFMSVVWVADTAAYLVGRQWGRHKILPQASPQKSWEGLVAGLLAAGAWGYWAVEWAGGLAPLPSALGGSLLALVGFFGDAWQSAWKRYHGLKDSGTLLPGHGGLWDRVDALLWVAPFWFFWHQKG
ncbi:MAG: phosphatidate cytidylyltransferase [Bacteroidia bacterium]